MCEAVEKDLYAVLGASPSDSVQQLRHRYQQLALQVNTLLCLSLSQPEATHNHYILQIGTIQTKPKQMVDKQYFSVLCYVNSRNNSSC